MNAFLPFENRKQCCKILLDDIFYIKQEGRLLYVITEEEIFRCYQRMEDILEFLDKRFYRCLKKITLNFQNVSALKDQTDFFKNGDKIFLGRQNYIHTRQSFAAYIKKPCNFNDFIV